MQITILAIGRLKNSAELQLCQRYLTRLQPMGRSQGFHFNQMVEFAESHRSQLYDRKKEEANKMAPFFARNDKVILLDEAGKEFSSQAFAHYLRSAQQKGLASMLFAIGGPDGHCDSLRGQCNLQLSFGKMTFPHQLVRVLLLEQLYRAMTILANHPYHRE